MTQESRDENKTLRDKILVIQLIVTLSRIQLGGRHSNLKALPVNLQFQRS
jgi:hypothetical protein